MTKLVIRIEKTHGILTSQLTDQLVVENLKLRHRWHVEMRKLPREFFINTKWGFDLLQFRCHGWFLLLSVTDVLSVSIIAA